MLQLILADNETLSTADRMGLVAGAIADLKLAGVVASGDPIFAIYIGGLNQYVFCGDDPVNYVDPIGLDAYVAVSGNKITIQIPVIFTGNADYRQKVQKAIEGRWSSRRRFEMTLLQPI